LQSHEHRSEFWIVTKGTALVNLEEEEYELSKGEYIFIPLNSKHRLSNNSTKLLEVIEIQFGDILSEDDITRYEDTYGRIS
jgi:mannose-6-phosphate isomerase-like protein (cupin superfamily)